MLKGKGFHAVGRVEIKAETSIPGVGNSNNSNNRRRRSLPKSDFTVFENGGFIKGINYDTRYSSHRTQAKPVEATEMLLNDSRASAVNVRCKNGQFYCSPSMERFSGHTGVCRVLGSKSLPIVPHALQLGDLIRIGSVGLVVCEVNRTTSMDACEALTDSELNTLKRNYVSLQHSQDEHTEPAIDPKDVDGAGSSGADTSDDEMSGLDEETNNAATGKSTLSTQKCCYICYDEDVDPENPLVAPCKCKGDTKFVHLRCLQHWNNGTEHMPHVCSVTNTDGLDICTICKTSYQTSVRLPDGRFISLLAQKLPPPFVTFAVVTQHETRSRATALTNSRFQLSFASLVGKSNPFLTIGRSTTNHMILRYRTVSQLHAKIKYQGNQFHLVDASSSNGTMLFLSKPLELAWGKTVHVKIGKTIMCMKAKKRWRWGDVHDGSQQQQQQHETESQPTPRQSTNSLSIVQNVGGVNEEGTTLEQNQSLVAMTNNYMEGNSIVALHDYKDE